MSRLSRWARRRRRAREEGYVAVMTAVLSVLLIGVASFAVDVGQWYVVAREAQRAADAGALGGVPYLPGDPGKAFATATDLSADNGYADADADVTVTTGIEDTPTQLRVTVSRYVPSILGGIFGIDGTTITRSAVADYAGPVPLGSPCNAYGNDPEPGDSLSEVCADVGEFWGNVGSPKASKVSGDAYHNNVCASGVDQCVSGRNLDYDSNGYFYTVTVTEDVPNLALEVFDPALVHVGDLCEKDVLRTKVSGKTVYAKDLGSKALPGVGATTVYAEGKTSPYCTGDVAFANATSGFASQVATNYTVRDPGPNPWDPLSYPVRTGCEGTGTYPGYAGNLMGLLDTTAAAYRTRPPELADPAAVAGEDGYVAKVFRRWTRLCTIPLARAGTTYMLQIKTNGLGADAGSGHNRFALRAYSTTDTSARDTIAISGYSRMAMYANLPEANTQFYLARVPSGAAGQILNVKLFDVGDSTTPGSIRVLAPPDSGVTFSNCRASGVTSGSLPTCQLTGVNSKYNGKWQTISVPIPLGYTCDDRDATKCWVRLQYAYGAGNQPSDTTSWAASIEGDPVRLIE